MEFELVSRKKSPFLSSCCCSYLMSQKVFFELFRVSSFNNFSFLSLLCRFTQHEEVAQWLIVNKTTILNLIERFLCEQMLLSVCLVALKSAFILRRWHSKSWCSFWCLHSSSPYKCLKKKLSVTSEILHSNRARRLSYEKRTRSSRSRFSSIGKKLCVYEKWELSVFFSSAFLVHLHVLRYRFFVFTIFFLSFLPFISLKGRNFTIFSSSTA